MEKKRLLEFVKSGTGELLTFKARQYFVTEDGSVWNDDLKRYVSQFEKRGYMAVTLRDDNGKWHTCLYVHNLVVSVFQRMLQKGEAVHHIDHDRKNNRLENLTIIDSGEHTRMHWADGTMDGVGEKLRNVGNSYNPAKQVAQLSLDGRLIKVWPSTQECQRNGFDHGHISRCCRGEKKTHHGFKWMYLSDYQRGQQPSQPVQLELIFS